MKWYQRILHFLFGHSWIGLPMGEPTYGDDEWGMNRYGGALVSFEGMGIYRKCKRCGLVQEQTDRIWGEGLTFKAVWTDVPTKK